MLVFTVFLGNWRTGLNRLEPQEQPSQGCNTGSNPVGSANNIKYLATHKVACPLCADYYILPDS